MRVDPARKSAPTHSLTNKPSSPPASSVAARRLWRVNRIYWLTVIYSGAWTLLRANGALGYAPLPARSRLAIGIVVLIAIVSLTLRTRSALRRGGYGRADPSGSGWVFTLVDLVALTAALRLTGGMDSALWPILFVIVVAETVLETTRAAWYVRIGVGVALMVACVPYPFHGGPYLLELATRLLFLMVVTSVARRLREGAANEQSEIAALRAELALSEERSQLSREVHDGVGNSLAAAVLRLEVAAREQERGLATLPLPTLLREEAQALREAMNTVRDWTFWTRPWSISGAKRTGQEGEKAPPDSGAARLREEIARLSRRTGLPIRLEGAELLDEPALAESSATTLRLTLFRIAQEALTNVAKHATGATGALVTLERDGKFIRLIIADDGPGFETGSGESGVGLSSMRERAEGAGGTLSIGADSNGAGTTIVARLPLA